MLRHTLESHSRTQGSLRCLKSFLSAQPNTEIVAPVGRHQPFLMKRAPSCGRCGELTGRSRLAGWEISVLLIPRPGPPPSSQASLEMGSLAPKSFNAPRGILMFSRMCLSCDDAASKRVI